MNVPFVDLKAQYASLKPQMDTAIQSVLDRAAFILGKDLADFEQAFAQYVGVKHVVGVCSGTDALEMALRACGIGPGDEVITVPNTYIATCEAISQVGATIRWVEVDERTYNMNMDPANVEAAITPRTKALLPVHLYGQPADMAPIMAVARKHGLKVIEDCAQAHGATYRIDGRGKMENEIGHPSSTLHSPSSILHSPSSTLHSPRVGTFGDVACFSFYPGKNLGAYGDGGAVLTDDDEIADRVRLLRNHGQREKYVHLIEGYCHRLDNLQAAVLGVKLPYLDGWNAARWAHAALYDKLLADVPGVVTPYVSPDVEHVYHLYVIQVPDRDRVQAALKAAGVETGIHYPIPLHEQPAYARLGHKPEDFPISHELGPRILSLPMFPELTDEQIHYVVNTLKRAVANGE
jgi:dTDP-4-amino-4,6-dideoxygalactose transaminase